MKKIFSYMLMAAAVSTASLSFTGCSDDDDNNDDDPGTGGGNSSTEVVEGAMSQAGTVGDGIKLNQTCGLTITYNTDGTPSTVGSCSISYNPLVISINDEGYTYEYKNFKFNDKGYVTECESYLNEEGYWEKTESELSYNSDGNLTKIKADMKSSDGKGKATIKYTWRGGNLVKIVSESSITEYGYWAKNETEIEYSSTLNKYQTLMPSDVRGYSYAFPISAIGLTGKGSKNLASKVTYTDSDSEEGVFETGTMTYEYDLNEDGSVNGVTEHCHVSYTDYESGSEESYDYDKMYGFGYSNTDEANALTRVINVAKAMPEIHKLFKQPAHK